MNREVPTQETAIDEEKLALFEGLQELSNAALGSERINHFIESAKFFVALDIDTVKWIDRLQSYEIKFFTGDDLLEKMWPKLESNPELRNAKYIRSLLEEYINFQDLISYHETTPIYTEVYTTFIQILCELNQCGIPILMPELLTPVEFQAILIPAGASSIEATLDVYIGLHYAENGFEGVSLAIEKINQIFQITHWEKMPTTPRMIKEIAVFLFRKNYYDGIRKFIGRKKLKDIDQLYKFIEASIVRDSGFDVEMLEIYLVDLIRTGKLEDVLTFVRIFPRLAYSRHIRDFFEVLQNILQNFPELKHNVEKLFDNVLSTILSDQSGSIFIDLMLKIRTDDWYPDIKVLVRLYKIAIALENKKLLTEIDNFENIINRFDSEDKVLNFFLLLIKMHKSKSLKPFADSLGNPNSTISIFDVDDVIELFSSFSLNQYDIADLIQQANIITDKYNESSPKHFLRHDELCKEILVATAIWAYEKNEGKRFREIILLPECNTSAKNNILEKLVVSSILSKK